MTLRTVNIVARVYKLHKSLMLSTTTFKVIRKSSNIRVPDYIISTKLAIGPNIALNDLVGLRCVVKYDNSIVIKHVFKMIGGGLV